MDIKKIVVTGGPSTGKTSVIEKLEEKGFLCLHEVIRMMTLAKKKEDTISFKTNPILSVSDPIAFNQELLNARIAQYKSVQHAGEEIFFDRGIPDVLAYMDCFGQQYNKEFEEACSTFKYDLVFLMPPWKEIHVTDNERLESYEESLRINDCLAESYSRFGYDLHIVPKGSVEERVNFILDLLNTKK